MLNISGINDGIVIDHIGAGHALTIYKYLNLAKKDCCVAIITNAKSNKMVKKDIIKIEGDIEVDLNILRILDNNITINVIKDGKISEKISPILPELITNVIRCKNPRCITSLDESLNHKFKLTNKEKAVYRCYYCEQQFDKKQLAKLR